MHRHFDPVSLRLFIAVCEEGNIALAAEREAIVPSAISKRVAALEDHVGTLLLNRGRRGIEPTAAGEVLLRQAREILSMMERTHAELSAFKDGVHGSVRILASLSVLAEALPDDIARFLIRNTSVRITLEEKISAEIVRSVREGRADLGICWNAGNLTDLDQVAYRSDHLCVVARTDHPVAQHAEIPFAEVLDHEMINVQPGSIMQLMLQRHAAIIGKRLSFGNEVANFDSASRVVAAGLGIAILPFEIASAQASALGLRLVPLADEWATRRFVIVSRPATAISVAARALVSHLIECAREEPAQPVLATSDPV